MSKVVIVTGANGGLGKHVSQALYAKNARVYMLARSEEQTREAMAAIKAAVPKSTGDLVFLHLDLADLTSVRKTADDFLRKERSLHLLFNNAGVGFPEKGSKTKQGYELQLGVNCIGPWALTKYLTPTLVSTAEISPPDTVRVVWVSSSVAVYASTKNFVQNLNPNESSANKYFVSKLGNYFQATEFASRHKSDGIISVSLNPGNLKTEFWRTQKGVMAFILNNFILYPSILGGYTLLFAGTSPKVTIRETGSYSSSIHPTHTDNRS